MYVIIKNVVIGTIVATIISLINIFFSKSNCNDCV